MITHTRPLPPVFAMALVVAATGYTAALCLLNTLVVPVSNGLVAIVDGAIVLGALALCMRGSRRAVWITLLAMAANFLLLALLSERFDPKAVRDPLVLIVFTYLGFRYGTYHGARFAFFLISTIVLVFAALEYGAPSAFVALFNVIDFYNARGVVDAATLHNLDSTFFISGARPDERMLLPFLGPHRVSSIFLEPVSMGNFGAIAAAFALSLDRAHRRTALAAATISVIVIILADARFASMVTLLFVAARFIPLRWSALALAPMPLVAIAILIAFALSNVGAGDDLPTRLAGSGRVLMELTPGGLFGLESYGVTAVDSGYAHAFSAFGLPLCVALWIAFVCMPTPNAEAARFKLLLGVYVCALLCISGTSLFALKTAALAWFIAGTLSARLPQRASAPRPAALSAPQGVPA